MHLHSYTLQSTAHLRMQKTTNRSIAPPSVLYLPPFSQPCSYGCLHKAQSPDDLWDNPLLDKQIVDGAQVCCHCNTQSFFLPLWSMQAP